MSKRKKSFGRVKPTWVGKTPTSLIKRVEEMLIAPHRPVQRRQTDNTKLRVTLKDYRGRCASTRKDDRAAAKAHPVDTWVRGEYAGTRFTGKVIRIRNGKYTLRLVSGQTATVPCWVKLTRLGSQHEWADI